MTPEATEVFVDSGVKIKTAVADKGYRGHEAWPGARLILGGSAAWPKA